MRPFVVLSVLLSFLHLTFSFPGSQFFVTTALLHPVFGKPPPNMFLDICLSLFLIPFSLCSVSASRLARNDNLDATLQMRAQPMSDDQLSLYTFNTSATDAGMVLQTSLGHAYQIFCEKASIGLEARDCFTALRQGPTGDVQESWASPVSPPSIHADVRLPIRLVSGRHQIKDEIEVVIINTYCLDDATCMIGASIKSTAPNLMARASARNVTEAARAIIQECVIRRRTGGHAMQIGKSTTHSGRQQGNLNFLLCYLEKKKTL